MKKTCSIVLGNILIALALSTFIFRNNIVAGGVSGLGIIVQHYMGISVTAVVGIVNIILFVVGLAALGKQFALKTLLSTVIFPILLEFFNKQTVLNGLVSDLFLSCVLAGIMLGCGIGLILKAGGSTGGFDIIGILFEKYFKLPVSLTFYTIDLILIILQCSFRSSEQIIYGILIVLISAYVTNHTLMSGQGLAQIMIMSDRYTELKKAILNEVDAGVTLLQGTKAYSGKETNVLLTVVSYRKLPIIKETVKRIDRHAFIIVSKVEEMSENRMETGESID